MLADDLEGDEDEKTMLILLLMTMFRDSTSVSESTGSLASNDSLDHLRSSAEPVVVVKVEVLQAWINCFSSAAPAVCR